MKETLKVVGHNAVRLDILEKVTATAEYTDDIAFGPNLLHMAVLGSPYAHAEIVSIDTSEAKKLPGVKAVLTGKDYPEKFGLYLEDKSIFPVDRVRQVGEQVAGVVATTYEIARNAVKLIKVEYKELPLILDPYDSVAEGAVLIHPDLGNYKIEPWLNAQPGTNVAHLRQIRKGDIEKGFLEADEIVEGEYYIPHVAHTCIETHISVSKFSLDGRLTMWNSTQSPHTQRNIMANALGMAHKDIRVIAPPIGGGFGGKAGISMEVMAAAGAKSCPGHPVKLRWSREEEFSNSSQRTGLRNKVKIGFKKNGKIVAFKHEMFWDVGASAEYGSNVVNATGFSATGPYYIPNVYIDSKACYTNNPTCSAYRGFGYSEFSFGVESTMDRAAKILGIDAVELRKINAIKEGEGVAYDVPMNPNGLIECIDKVAAEIEWGKEEKSDDPNKIIAKGFASVWKAPAMPANESSSAFIKFSEDGSINILVSGMDLGQGFLTAMAKIAAEVLGLTLDKVRVELPDTDRNPYEWQTVASHVTWSCGNAVKRAAIDARNKIFDTVQRAHFIDASQLYLEDNGVKCTTQDSFYIPFSDFVITGIQTEHNTWIGGPILGSGMFMPEYTNAMVDPNTGLGGHPMVHYTVGAGAVKVEIDKETGRMKVLKMAEAFDLGKAINPDLAKDQINGGFVQGLGTALWEECIFNEKGKMLNDGFTDYKIPTILDVPRDMNPILVEVPQPDGPYGARGHSEHTMIPVMPAIANAVANGLGVRITDVPVTSEKVAMRMNDPKYKEDMRK